MNTGTHSTEPHDVWLDRIEQQLREQDEAFELAMKALAEMEPVSIGLPCETLEELREACATRSLPDIAPVFATRC